MPRRFRDTDNLCFAPGSSDQNAAEPAGTAGPRCAKLHRRARHSPGSGAAGDGGTGGSPAAVPMVTEDAGVAARGATFGTSRSNGQGKRRGGEAHRARAMR